MVASFRRQRLILPLAPVVSGALGLLTALAFAVLPIGVIEQGAIASGLAGVLPAAAPPLGITARMGLILAGGAGVTALLWAGLYLAIGTRVLALTFGGDCPERDELPVLRRADAHPDAPARRPISAARDLGEPTIVDEPAGRDLPDDLDQPLAAFDPQAILAVPAEPVRPVAALAHIKRPQVFDPGDRFDTFVLAPQVVSAPPVRPRPEATIHALLDRLEQGMSRRDQPLPALCTIATDDRVDDALGALRRLASAR
ncbi:hypothetical protein ACFO8O_00710 [Hephaestia sp. GCM10023244]|uniref:hypothetical protein n=1 Tax=unclassified Hephaestia TaxID=2631281 RepID=UPI002076F4EE|nr:hypothetical protein [Hephaestia sp. MAHUQ-44]MCM8729489.1 hypothetical protein [Hephaestia sp. MAHUQ-44]